MDRRLYEEALERPPQDPQLIVSFAQFLDGNDMDIEALKRDLLPDTAWTHYYLGALLAGNGRYEAAEASLERALEILGEFKKADDTLKALRGRM